MQIKYKRAHIVVLFFLSATQMVWADTNPYLNFTDGNSGNSESNPLTMMQASPASRSSTADSSNEGNVAAPQEGPVYQVSAVPAPQPIAVPQYVQPAPLVQAAQNLGKTSQPSRTAPSTQAATTKQAASPASPPGPSLNSALAKQLITHNTGFNALYPVLGSQKLVQAMRWLLQSNSLKDYQAGFQKSTSSAISNVMTPVDLSFSSIELFAQGAGKDGVSPGSTLNAAVALPFQDSSWMQNLQNASGDQVLKVIAVEGALHNYLLNQILQHQVESELMQTAQIRSVYDLANAMQGEARENDARQKEILQTLQAILAVEEKNGGHKK